MKHPFSHLALPLIVLLSGLLPYGCNHSDDPLEIPSRFKYAQLDFQPTRFYVLTAGAYSEIPATGNYTAYDETLEEFLDINTTEFEIEELELLDETSVRVHFFDHLNPVPTDTLLNYELTDQLISVNIGGISIPFLLDSDNQSVRAPLFTIHHSKRLSGTSVDYSPMDISLQRPEDVATVIQQQRNQFGLQAGDTIAVNNSTYRYNKQ